MEEIQTRLLSYLDAIEEHAGEAAGQAWELLVNLAFAQSVAEIIMTVICLILTGIGLKLIFTFMKKYNQDGEDSAVPFLFVSAFITFFLGIGSMFQIFNTWMWIGLISPEARALQKILMTLGANGAS